MTYNYDEVSVLPDAFLSAERSLIRVNQKKP